MKNARTGWAAIAGLAVAGLMAGAESARAQNARPDFQGFWQAINTAEFNLEPHDGHPGIPPGMGVVVGDTIPYKPEALAKRQENFKQRDTADPVARCYMAGIPRATYMGFPLQIVQTPDHVVILYEYAHATRLIPLNQKFVYDDVAEFWMGEARARYEGGTLIIESHNFNADTWFDRSGNYHSNALKVTERLTKLDADTITYEATIEDPEVFLRPWTISMPLYRRKEKNMQLLEYECYSFTEGAFDASRYPTKP